MSQHNNTVLSVLNRRKYQKSIQNQIDQLQIKMKKEIKAQVSPRLFHGKCGSLQEHLKQKHQIYRELKVLSKKSKNLQNRQPLTMNNDSTMKDSLNQNWPDPNVKSNEDGSQLNKLGSNNDAEDWRRSDEKNGQGLP